MGNKLEITESLYLEKKPVFKMGLEGPGFRWGCKLCIGRGDWKVPRLSDWGGSVSVAFEGAKQHWTSCHAQYAISQVAWNQFHKQLGAFAGDNEPLPVDWFAQFPLSGDWGPYRNFADKLVGKKATVQFTNLNTGAVSTVTGASFSYTTAEEKKGMSRLSDIEARLRELEKEAAKYARFPKTDEWPVGTVITYDVSPMPNDEAKVFTYAVIKAADENWYWTGSWRPGFQTGNYDMLVERLADDNVSNIRVATPEDFDPLFPELEDLVGLEDTKTVEEVSEKLADKGIYVPVVKGKNG